MGRPIIKSLLKELNKKNLGTFSIPQSTYYLILRVPFKCFGNLVRISIATYYLRERERNQALQIKLIFFI